MNSSSPDELEVREDERTFELMKRVVTRLLAREITIAYGMTETSPVSFQSDTRDSLERRVSTVGRIHPHVEVKVVDPVSGATVGIGEVGELFARGFMVMKGYYGNPDATAAAADCTACSSASLCAARCDCCIQYST